MDTSPDQASHTRRFTKQPITEEEKKLSPPLPRLNLKKRPSPKKSGDTVLIATGSRISTPSTPALNSSDHLSTKSLKSGSTSDDKSSIQSLLGSKQGIKPPKATFRPKTGFAKTKTNQKRHSDTRGTLKDENQPRSINMSDSKLLEQSLRGSVTTEYTGGFTISEGAIERAIKRRGTSVTTYSHSTVASAKKYRSSNLVQPTESELIVSSDDSLKTLQGKEISKPNILSHKKTTFVEHAKTPARRQKIMFINDGLTAKLFGNKLDRSRKQTSPVKSTMRVTNQDQVTQEAVPVKSMRFHANVASVTNVAESTQKKGVRFLDVDDAQPKRHLSTEKYVLV